MKPTSPHQAAALLQPDDVIYLPGWSYCYRIASAPFCRLHYLRWQGHPAAAPSDPPGYIAYCIQPLAGQRLEQLLVRAF